MVTKETMSRPRLTPPTSGKSMREPTFVPRLTSYSKLYWEDQRWDATYYDEHRQKVRDIKPVVDTKPPRTYMHLHLKLKKLQLEEERLATIERDNRILLEKMSHIMRTRGRIDNRNNYEYKSLNREKRMRELLRITKENQEILRRITARKPEYDHMEWERDWEEKQKHMDAIAAYPRDWWKEDKADKGSRASSRQNSTRREKKNKQDEEGLDEQEEDEEKDEEKETPQEQNRQTDEDEQKNDDTQQTTE